MARLDLTLLRRFGLAALRGIGAAGVELAAGRRVGRGRDGALQHHALALDSRVRDGNGREQRLGVGVQRVGKNFSLGVQSGACSQGRSFAGSGGGASALRRWGRSVGAGPMPLISAMVRPSSSKSSRFLIFRTGGRPRNGPARPHAASALRSCSAPWHRGSGCGTCSRTAGWPGTGWSPAAPRARA